MTVEVHEKYKDHKRKQKVWRLIQIEWGAKDIEGGDVKWETCEEHTGSDMAEEFVSKMFASAKLFGGMKKAIEEKKIVKK